MKTSSLAAALLVAACFQAYAYNPCSAEFFNEPGQKVMLIPEGSNKGVGNFRLSGLRLDGDWKQAFNAIFTSEHDGAVCLRFGPDGTDYAPAFFKELKINGKEQGKDLFKVYDGSFPDGARKGVISEIDGRAMLTLYSHSSAYCLIRVKRGERMQITVMGKSGSIADTFKFCIDELGASLDESLRIKAKFDGDAMKSGVALAGKLNELIAFSNSKLGLRMEPLSANGLTLSKLREKTSELSIAFARLDASTAGNAKPVLYDDLQSRRKFKELFTEARIIANQLKTSRLIDFTLN